MHRDGIGGMNSIFVVWLVKCRQMTYLLGHKQCLFPHSPWWINGLLRFAAP